MTNTGSDAMPRAPQLIRQADRQPATGLPAGVVGEKAFCDEGAWVGFLQLAPEAMSGWHHHGEWDSYAYVMTGTLRWEFGDGGRDGIEVGPGDAGHMPARVIHRDVSAGSETLSMVLFRAGHGELTVDVAGPDADARRTIDA